MNVNLRNKLALNLIFQIIIVLAAISSGFYFLSVMQAKEIQRRIFDKAELYSSILGANLDKIVGDNLAAFRALQKATVEAARSQDNVEELRVIAKDRTVVSSSTDTGIWEPTEDKYRAMIDEVIDQGLARSITVAGMGKETVIHFMPILIPAGQKEQLIGLIQIHVRFPSQQQQVIANMRANSRAFFRQEANDIANSLGEVLKEALLETERNFGYLQRLIDNIRSDPDIKDIRLFSQDLGVLISSEQRDIPRFIDREHTELQARAMQQGKTAVAAQKQSQRTLLVASPLYLQKDGENHIAGAIEIAFSLEQMHALIRENRDNVLLMNLAIAFIFCFLIGLFFKQRIFGPIRELTSLTERIKRDDFSQRSRIRSDDEFGRLAKDFNSMMDELDQSRKEIKDWNQRLQQRIEQVTAELEKKQKQLLESEKLASLGVLSAGIAHEINNPLGVILGQTQMLLRDVRKEKEAIGQKETEEFLLGIEENVRRCSHIVQSLLKFTKTKTLQLIKTNVHASIEDALQYTKARLAMKNIQVTKKLLSSDPFIDADPVQIDQVFINILVNAQQSIDKDGEIRITTYIEHDKDARAPKVCISFQDNGAGIDPRDLPKVFDPFFSTKEPGEGVGLGLSVSYGIIRAHGGDIEIKSEKNKGTQTIVKLPLKV